MRIRTIVTPPGWTACILCLCALLAIDSARVGTTEAAPQSRRQVLHAPAPNATPAAPRLPERSPFSKAEQDVAVVPGMPRARSWADSEQDFIAMLPLVAGPWLILSAGGSDGAYSAGILTGWTQTGARPDFSVVTGVSTGAMLAPFAFLGARYDETLRTLYSTITSADVFEVGGKGESLLDTWPLRDLLAKHVTPQLLAEIAAEHSRGRRLVVLTTNLDAERPVVWNMGEIAARGDDVALKLFRDVLLASSSIPGAFPPVYIDVEAKGRHFQEMHADGGMGGAFFLAPSSLLSRMHGAPLPASEFYVIVNSKLAPDFHGTERNILNILGRSISVTLKTTTRVALEAAHDYAARNAIGFHLAYIDDTFDKESRGSFDPGYMRALIDLGADQGRRGSAFRNEPPRVASQQDHSQQDHTTASCRWAAIDCGTLQ
jgi:predicted acylesterase/phospholipase RssA